MRLAAGKQSFVHRASTKAACVRPDLKAADPQTMPIKTSKGPHNQRQLLGICNVGLERPKWGAKQSGRVGAKKSDLTASSARRLIADLRAVVAAGRKLAATADRLAR